MIFNIHEIFVNDISQIERVLLVWNYEKKSEQVERVLHNR